MAILKIKDDNGNVFDIPAIRGKDGYTPVKGTDYFTEVEKQEIYDAIFTALPIVELHATKSDGSLLRYAMYGMEVVE